MYSMILVDFDDTLVDTGPRFLARRRALFDFLSDLGFDREEARTVHHDVVETELFPIWGFGPFRLAPSFRDTYLRLCARSGQVPDRDLARGAEALAAGIESPPPPLPGAIEALRRLASALPVLIWTQSHFPTYQRSALDAAGVTGIVGADRILITPHKTAESFLDAVQKGGGATALDTCMVGNSLRHDVNPALQSGAHAIRVREAHTWQMDRAEPIHQDFLEVASLSDAADVILESRMGAVSPRRAHP